MRAPSLARAAALVALAMLAGCPLPQAVPEYSKGTPTILPVILPSSVSPADSIVKVSIQCVAPNEPVFSLKADLVDQNTTEPIEARWFVDYDPTNSVTSYYVRDEAVPAPQDPTQLRRTVPGYDFAPFDIEKRYGLAPTAGAIHVVELVVASNGFNPDPSPTGTANPLPYRTPLPGLETQAFRWVFQYADIPCPQAATP